MKLSTVGPLFDRVNWQDPISAVELEPIILARTPAGVPICGALRIKGTSFGYPIVDCIARLTPELAYKYRDWLKQLSLMPPKEGQDISNKFQQEASVESFGWQWSWNNNMRSEADLRMRVAERFNFNPAEFKGKVVADMGCGAGDQSRYILKHGAQVVSVDLSNAIEVTAAKLRMHPGWVGVQGDITVLPFAGNQFDIVYCEGVIQHTRDSKQSVSELCRVTKIGGSIFASHYTRQAAISIGRRLRRKFTLSYYNFLRSRLSRMDRYKLLFVTGLLAVFNYLPLIGKLLRKSGTVLYYSLMPDFKTTWTNTFDYYGNHSFQRFITPEEFWSYFEGLSNVELIIKNTGVVAARKDR